MQPWGPLPTKDCSSQLDHLSHQIIKLEALSPLSYYLALSDNNNHALKMSKFCFKKELSHPQRQSETIRNIFQLKKGYYKSA